MKTKLNKTVGLALITFLFFIGTSYLQAQGQGKQGGRQGPPPLPNDEQIEQMVDDLSSTLSLSKKQEKEVSDLYFAHFEELVTMREKEQADREAKREEMEKNRSDFEDEVKSVLTDDQQKEYDAWLKTKKSERSGKGKPKE